MAVIFFDFDSTVVGRETLDSAIAIALSGRGERDKLVKEVEAITNLGMEGKLDFKESVKRRLQIVSLSKLILEKVGRLMLGEITRGMPRVFNWLKENNHETFIVSGGFEECIAPVAEKLGIKNENRLTNRFLFGPDGEVIGVDEESPLWTSEGKTPALRHIRNNRSLGEKFIIVGDGMNDYRAYESGAADLFCGFGAHVRRKAVVEKAPHFFTSAQELLHFFMRHL